MWSFATGCEGVTGSPSGARRGVRGSTWEYVGGRTSKHASARTAVSCGCSQAKLLSKDKKIARLKTVANYLLSTVTSENLDHLKRELADLVKTKVYLPAPLGPTGPVCLSVCHEYVLVSPLGTRVSQRWHVLAQRPCRRLVRPCRGDRRGTYLSNGSGHVSAHTAGSSWCASDRGRCNIQQKCARIVRAGDRGRTAWPVK